MRIRSPLPARPTAWLLALSLLVCSFAGGIARAAGAPPLVVAVDVSLDADARATADAAIARLADALPPGTELGLIAFDDVVLRAVPLAPVDAARLDEIDAALATASRDVDGNLAVGLERALDELGDRDGAHVVLFARARIGGADEASRARFADWYRELLLPDAAASGTAITLVAPPGEVDTSVLDDIGTHPANTVVELASGNDPDAAATLVTTLLGRLSSDDTTVDTALAANESASPGEAGILADDGDGTLADDGTGTLATDGAGTLVTDGAGTLAADATGTASPDVADAPSTSEPPANVSAAPTAATGTTTDDGASDVAPDRRLRWLFVALAVLAAATLLVAVRRDRPVAPATQTRDARREGRSTRILTPTEAAAPGGVSASAPTAAPTAGPTAGPTAARVAVPTATTTAASTLARTRERPPGNAADAETVPGQAVTVRHPASAASDLTAPRDEGTADEGTVHDGAADAHTTPANAATKRSHATSPTGTRSSRVEDGTIANFLAPTSGGTAARQASSSTRDDGTIADFVTRRSDASEPVPDDADETNETADATRPAGRVIDENATARTDASETGAEKEIDELELLSELTARRNRQDPLD